MITCFGRGGRPESGKTVKVTTVLPGALASGVSLMPACRAERQSSMTGKHFDPTPPAAQMHMETGLPNILVWRHQGALLHVSLIRPPAFTQLFPERCREAHRNFERLALKHAAAVLQTSEQSAHTKIPISSGLLPELVRLRKRIRRRFMEPLSVRMAAQFLGIDKRGLSRLRQDGLLKPDCRVEACSHGRRYQYAAYRVPDLIAFALTRAPDVGHTAKCD